MRSKQQEVCDTGRVIELQNKHAIVEIENKRACNNCALSSFCLQNKKDDIRLKMKNTMNAKIGDKVKFEIPPGIKILSNFYVFILPLIIIIITYLFAKNIFNLSENLSIIISVLSLILSYFIIKYINRNFKKNEIIKVKMIKIMT